MKYSIFLLSILLINACGKQPSILQGAGATFPAPIYNQLFADYSTKEGNPSVIYQGVGSGAGIQNIATGIVDFGATDAFLSDTEVMVQEQEVLHIPMVLAAVNFTYNIPNLNGNSAPLKLDAETIYKIYAGDITNWNDPAITTLNPNINLPDLTIVPVYRSDSSGTTFVMSEFMTKANTGWADTFGTGKTINWITGIGQKGNSSMMGFVKETPGAIAYVDLVYAKQNNFPVVAIKNKSGNFVIGGIEEASYAASQIAIPEDTRVSLTDATGTNSAPMTTFSYLLVRKEQNYNKRSLKQAQDLVKLLKWMYSPEAQQKHEELYFSPMPENVLILGQNIIESITYDGKPITETVK